MTEKDLGVDLDVLALHPPQPIDKIEAAVAALTAKDGFRRLATIDALKLDSLLEWCEPSERCIAVSAPLSSDPPGRMFVSDPNGTEVTKEGVDVPDPRLWQLVYDTQFSSLKLAAALHAAFPEATILYFNLQEARDGTLAIFRDDIRAGFSAEPSRVEDFEALDLGPIDTQLLKEFLPGDAPTVALRETIALLKARIAGERVKKMQPRTGGAYDALQALAKLAGTPHLYRFFEGWMKSDLDWDEDKIAAVWAFTTRD
jgi:hypothetical protein